MHHRDLAPLLLLLLCAASAADGPPSPVRPADLGATARVHAIGGLLLASQPSAADLQLAVQRGVRNVISLRHADEPVGFDERAEAGRLGLSYVVLPWNGTDELTDAVFDEARRLLRDSPRPLLLHCASGNRVGAVWIPWRVLDEGVTPEQAAEEARVIGLSTPGYEQKARDYIGRQRAAR